MSLWASGRGRLVLCGLLGLLTLIRLIVAGVTPLAPDEAYYWVLSRALAAGYLDHPPMVALWIRIGTAILGETVLGVRLLGPLSAALGSLLLADAAERLFPGRHAGVTAAALANATLLIGVGAVIMTPDTPLLFFWTVCLWAVARLLTAGSAAWWLVAGLAAGLAMESKYTAVLLWVGVGIWVLWVPAARRWLSSPMLWGGVAIGALAFAPIIVWNAQHGWASFLRQGGRVGDWQPARATQFLGELIGGQIGLATPLVFVLAVAGVSQAARQAWRARDPSWALLAMLTLPGVVLFVQHALGDRVEGNWPGVLYPASMIATSGLQSSFWRRLYPYAVVLGLALTALVYLQATTLLFSPLLPAGDPVSRQLRGWDTLADAASGARCPGGVSFVAAEQYGVASELAFDMNGDRNVVGVDPRWRLTTLPSVPLTDQPGILVRRMRDSTSIDPAIWQKATLLREITPTADVPGDGFRSWCVTGGNVTGAVLPRRFGPGHVEKRQTTP